MSALYGRVYSSTPPPTLDLLLKLHHPAIDTHFLPRRDLKAMHLLLPHRLDPTHPGGTLQLRALIEGLDVRGRSNITPLPTANLIELIIAPEQDIAAPIRVVVGEFRARAVRHQHGSYIVHDSRGMRRADGDGVEADGDGLVGFFVPFEEAREGGDFDGVGAGVDPAADAELACEAEAKGPGVCGGAALVGFGGVDGEEGGVAAGEDVGDFGLRGAAGVELLSGEEGGGIDIGGFGVEGEA